MNGLHVAIIMDGNGRWATSRGLPRIAGHRKGAEAVRRAVETAVDEQVTTLTLYAFSSDNWSRPRGEVRALMELFHEFLRTKIDECRENGVRIRVIGRRDRLSLPLVSAVRAAESRTAGCSRLSLNLAVDYSSRDTILRAASLAGEGVPRSRSEFALRLASAASMPDVLPEVDLLIRTGGEQRLSDFLLWECAYAELVFQPVMWPDFGAEDFRAALSAFRRRERRFGRVDRTASG